MTIQNTESKWSRAVEWLWRTKTITYARTHYVPFTERQNLYWNRTQAYTAFANQALEPSENGPFGLTTLHAISFYREAAYWALCTLQFHEKDLPNSLREAFELTLSSGKLNQWVPESLCSLVQKTLIEHSMIEISQLDEALQKAEAQIAQRFVRYLHDAIKKKKSSLAQLQLERWYRTSSALILILILVAVVGFGIYRRNLAANRTWIASSAHPGFPTSGNTNTHLISFLIFHTIEEDSPWFEIDLGQSRSIRTVEVINRRDCCNDRGFPLVIEVSQDRQQWTEVARRSESFFTWTAKFPTQYTRYVRARALRRTMLHFEDIIIR